MYISVIRNIVGVKVKPYYILGIDPGAGGALAFLDLANHTLSVFDMPIVMVETNGKSKKVVDGGGVAALVKKFRPQQAIIEKVHSSPQQGVVSAFSFGHSYGTVLGVLAALDVEVTKVPPSVWKRDMCVTSDKEQTVNRASTLMPRCAPVLWPRKKDTDRAEASLLALYCAAQNGHKFKKPLEPLTHE